MTRRSSSPAAPSAHNRYGRPGLIQHGPSCSVFYLSNMGSLPGDHNGRVLPIETHVAFAKCRMRSAASPPSQRISSDTVGRCEATPRRSKERRHVCQI